MTAPTALAWCGGAAAAGLAATVAGAAVEPAATARAVHPAALFWLALSVGALPILMTHHLTGGHWGDVTERLTRAVAAPLPVGIAVYLLLLGFGMPSLFEWTKPADQLPEVVQNKLLYLNIPFFAARTLAVLAVWLALAVALGAWRDERPAASPALGAGGLILWVIATTLFAFDWLMALEPRWYSDIFGLLLCLGFVVPAAAAVLVLACRHAPGDTGALSDFASLWLATILGWAFLAFSQYLIIWMGNIPDEIEWYMHRSAGGWRAIAWTIVLLLAVIPFAALLSGRLKRRPVALAAVAGVVLAGHLLHAVWLVLPTFHRDGLVVPWQTAAAWIGIGGLWCGWVGIRLSGRTLRSALRRKEMAHG